LRCSGGREAVDSLAVAAARQLPDRRTFSGNTNATVTDRRYKNGKGTVPPRRDLTPTALHP